MLNFQKAFNEQWSSVYGPSIKIHTRTRTYHIPDSEKTPLLEDIVQDIHDLADSVNVSFNTYKNAFIKKNHLILKKWVDSVYHNYAGEEVHLNDLTKIKGLIEEFISETDDYILDDYLQRRKEDYKDLKRTEEMLLEFL